MNLISKNLEKAFRSLRIISQQNFKTIFFNFKYLPFIQAAKMPIKIARKVHLWKAGGKIVIDCHATPGMIEIGYGEVGIFDRGVSRTIWQVSGTIIFKGHAHIGHGSKISVAGTLVLGRNFIISAESSIIASERVEFGENCLISWQNLVMDTDLHKIKYKSGEMTSTSKPIIIGSKVWIGCRCLILKGSIIPNNVVIAANTLVNKPLEQAGALYGGQPVKMIKEDVEWVY